MEATKVDRCPDCRAVLPGRSSRYCGVRVCTECGAHRGLDRCYCGWSRSGGNGRAELQEDGEVIDSD